MTHGNHNCASVNLYAVQDAERPMWVVAESYSDAVKRWKEVVAIENEQADPADVNDPHGVALVCDGHELLLP